MDADAAEDGDAAQSRQEQRTTPACAASPISSAAEAVEGQAEGTSSSEQLAVSAAATIGDDNGTDGYKAAAMKSLEQQRKRPCPE